MRGATPVPFLVGVLLAAAAAGPAVAHGPERKPPDLVWLQGFRETAPAKMQAHEMPLIAHGKPYKFFATDWRHFSVTGAPAVGAPGSETPLFLQGTPEALAKFSTAPAGRRISILAEWRPGRRDLFIQVVDVCTAP